MGKPAAFKATFSDFRLIKGRKVAQLIFELPIEGCDAALEAMGGVPQPHEERWAAIARIDLKAVSEPTRADVEPLKEQRSFSSLPLSQQAALRCNDYYFRQFINQACHVNQGIDSAEGAASFVRIHCKVGSRSDIKFETDAGDRWISMNDKYEVWLREKNFR